MFKLYDMVKVKGIAIPGIYYGSAGNDDSLVFWDDYWSVYDILMCRNLTQPVMVVNNMTIEKIEEPSSELSDEQSEIMEAQFLAREYLLCDDVDLAEDAIKMKRRIAKAIMGVCVND